MKVFLSWSGARSKAVAELLRDWLPDVIQSVEPWLSANDIEKGSRWSREIAQQLEASKVGIFCMTHENLNARWLLFEAGAISKAKDARACTFLLDIRPADIEPPLSEFQHTTCTKEDVFHLLSTINKAIERDGQDGERSLPDARLNSVFDRAWPELESKLKVIAENVTNEASAPIRTDRAILEEVLDGVRNLLLQNTLSGFNTRVRNSVTNQRKVFRVIGEESIDPPFHRFIVECPYCGYRDIPDWNPSQATEMECGDCHRKFSITPIGDVLMIPGEEQKLS
ncbi:MAG: toll/interleukin-1 receptor domain-containing protein [Abitibacteriaceae bacterium]|nr:toll/interleukin-1 receptor domain-containing protein [Abditibacteriaceae bacterium]